MDTLLQARPYFIRCIKSNEFLVGVTRGGGGILFEFYLGSQVV